MSQNTILNENHIMIHKYLKKSEHRTTETCTIKAFNFSFLYHETNYTLLAFSYKMQVLSNPNPGYLRNSFIDNNKYSEVVLSKGIHAFLKYNRIFF